MFIALLSCTSKRQTKCYMYEVGSFLYLLIFIQIKQSFWQSIPSKRQHFIPPLHLSLKLLPFTPRSIAFPIAVKVPNTNNLSEEEFILTHSSKGPVHCRTESIKWEVWQEGSHITPIVRKRKGWMLSSFYLIWNPSRQDGAPHIEDKSCSLLIFSGNPKVSLTLLNGQSKLSQPHSDLTWKINQDVRPRILFFYKIISL